MREIKFRAWDRKLKEMVFVDTIFQCAKGIDQYSLTTIRHLANYSYSAFPEKIVLTQFTGLKDKNGKEIYEGDIVRYSIQGTLQDSPIVIKIPDIFIELGHDDNYYLPQEETFEVIGNIYENPELNPLATLTGGKR